MHALGVVCRELLSHAGELSCLPPVHCSKDSYKSIQFGDVEQENLQEVGNLTPGPGTVCAYAQDKGKLVLTRTSVPVASGML